MISRKSRPLTVLFSLMPGAGQMFMGFMKIGVSLMAAFFLIIFLSSWLSIGPLLYLAPIIWFYAFFDSIGRCYASDGDFAAFKDHYLFINGLSAQGKEFGAKSKLIIGIIITVLGAILLFRSFNSVLAAVLPSRIYMAFSNIVDLIPQFAIGAAIIALGIYLIVNRGKGGETDA